MAKLKVVTFTLFLFSVVLMFVVFVTTHMKDGFFGIYDDAFISFRYVDNLFNGLGLTFNAQSGERLEGYSNFLLIIILYFFKFLHSSTVQNVLFLNLCLTAFFLFIYTKQNLKAGIYWCLASIFILLSNISFISAIHNGMETILFTTQIYLSILFCICGVKDRKFFVYASILLFFSALSRPEAPLVFLFLSLVLKLRNRDLNFNRREFYLYWILPFCLPLFCYYFWKYFYFGEIVPNSFYSKQLLLFYTFREKFTYGRYEITKFFNRFPELFFLLVFWPLIYLRTKLKNKKEKILFYFSIVLFILFSCEIFLFSKGVFLIFVLPLIFLIVKRGSVTISVTVTAIFSILLFIFSLGRDWCHYSGIYRFFVVLIPLILHLNLEIFTAQSFKKFKTTTFIFIFILISLKLFGPVKIFKNEKIPDFLNSEFNYDFKRFYSDLTELFENKEKLINKFKNIFNEEYYNNQFDSKVGKWIRENSTEEAVVATIQAGKFSYYLERDIIDLFGIVNKEVARLRREDYIQGLKLIISTKRPEFITVYFTHSAGEIYHKDLLKKDFLNTNGYNVLKFFKTNGVSFFILKKDYFADNEKLTEKISMNGEDYLIEKDGIVIIH